MRKLKIDVSSLRLENLGQNADGDIAAQDVHGLTNTMSLVTSMECCESGAFCEGTATYAGATCETTCNQIICGCSGGYSECDVTCPGYWNAAEYGC